MMKKDTREPVIIRRNEQEEAEAFFARIIQRGRPAPRKNMLGAEVPVIWRAYPTKDGWIMRAEEE